MILKYNGISVSITYRKDIVIEDVDNEGYIYDEHNDRAIVMNRTCFSIWKFVQKNTDKSIDISEIVDYLKSGYDCTIYSDDILKNDIFKTINDMIKLGIVIKNDF